MKEAPEVAKYVQSIKKAADHQAINATVAIIVNCSASDIGAGLADTIHNDKALRAIKCNAKVAAANVLGARNLGVRLVFITSGEAGLLGALASVLSDFANAFFIH